MMKNYFRFSFLAIVSAFLTISCELTSPVASAENEILDGHIEELNTQEKVQFLRGDEAFSEVFTRAKGLGPLFVANQCSACHPGDGKGNPFVQFTRFGQSDTTGNKFLAFGAPQLQHKAIPNYEPEKIPTGATFTSLIAPAVTGLGYLDAVSDADLIALSDPDDLDGDGISGKPHWNTIPNYVTLRPNSISRNGKYITRFGKKGAAYDLLHQTAGAYNQDMGITSIFEPLSTYSGLEEDPEVSTQVVNDVVAYLKTLKAPLPRNQNDAAVSNGKELFSQIQCAACHIPTLKTGFSPISALSNQEFHPYTDLLLHDMGEELNDNYTEGFALVSEWKTPALWGLGLSKDAQGGTYFLMHDGRARSIEQAILIHRGEAQQSKNNYAELSDAEQKDLIQFLESL